MAQNTEPEPKDTEVRKVRADEFSLCDLWRGLCALCDKIWGFGLPAEGGLRLRRAGSSAVSAVPIEIIFGCRCRLVKSAG